MVFIRRSTHIVPLIFALLFLGWAGAAQATSLRLDWTDNSSDETGFRVQRWDGIAYRDIAQTGANSQTYTDQNIVAGSKYCYRVLSINSSGTSAPSNQVCMTAVTSSPPPTTQPPASNPPAPSEPSDPANPLPPSGNLAVNGAWTDYRFQVNIRSDDNDVIGVLFRYVDTDNFYRFNWNLESRSRQIVRVKDGVATVLVADAVPYRKRRTYQLDIIVEGPQITVRINRRQIFSVTDSSFHRGTVGLFSSLNNGSIFDDVLVEDLQTGAVLLEDDFNDGNLIGWTLMDETSQRGPSAWSVVDGKLAQQSNIGFYDNADPWRFAGTIALFTARAWTDYRFRVKIRSDDNDTFGVLFRYVDGDNFYRFNWNQESPSRQLVRVKDGVATLLAADATPYRTGQTYQLDITVEGPNITVRIDDQEIFAVTDPSFTHGTVGLYSFLNAGSAFDDVFVDDIITGASFVLYVFDGGIFTGWTVIDETAKFGPSNWSVTGGELVQQGNTGLYDHNHPWRGLGTIAVYTE